MVCFPDELVEKTKKLFPEAKHLHEAVDNRDAMVVMGFLKELTIPITNITNEWLVVAIKNGRAHDITL